MTNSADNPDRQSEGASLRDRAFVPSGSSQQAVSPVPASIPSAVVVEELLAHLGAARMQLIPADDPIIANHIHAAHALALTLFKGTRA